MSVFEGSGQGCETAVSLAEYIVWCSLFTENCKQEVMLVSLLIVVYERLGVEN
jgi:hypothetical protein